MAENYIDAEISGMPHFTLEDVTYRQWDFNFGDGALGDAWIAEGTIEAKSGNEAIVLFHNKLTRTVPVISLISQCYMEFKRQPLLLKRLDADCAFMSYIYDSEPVPLMFMDDQYAGLQSLIANDDISPAFYKYWNDAQNTIGYSPKLLLMFSAIEALVRMPNGKKDLELQMSILAPELVDAIFTPNSGLRHRLVHGEYFSAADGGTDYVDQVHRKVIAYFNGLVGKEVISEGVVGPQRHLYDNKMIGTFFLSPKDVSTPLELREVVADMEANDHNVTKYDRVYDDARIKNY